MLLAVIFRSIDLLSRNRTRLAPAPCSLSSALAEMCLLSRVNLPCSFFSSCSGPTDPRLGIESRPPGTLSGGTLCRRQRPSKRTALRCRRTCKCGKIIAVCDKRRISYRRNNPVHPEILMTRIPSPSSQSITSSICS